jgi:hypothetical protein
LARCRLPSCLLKNQDREISEEERCTQLHHARVERRGDAVEVWAAETCAGRVEVGVVGKVESLQPKLEHHLLAQVVLLEGRSVEVDDV